MGNFLYSHRKYRNQNIAHSFAREENNTAQKIKFSIKDFFSKCDLIHSFLRIWSHLPK